HSLLSTRAVQFPQNRVQPKTCYEANEYPSGDLEPRLLYKIEKEFQDRMDRIVGLWLFLDEVDNNVFDDGANDCDDGAYPANPSRESLHRIDHKTRPSGNLILVFDPITEHQGHLEKFFSPSRYESDSLTAMGHGRIERASHGADGLFRC